MLCSGGPLKTSVHKKASTLPARFESVPKHLQCIQSGWKRESPPHGSLGRVKKRMHSWLVCSQEGLTEGKATQTPIFGALLQEQRGNPDPSFWASLQEQSLSSESLLGECGPLDLACVTQKLGDSNPLDWSFLMFSLGWRLCP